MQRAAIERASRNNAAHYFHKRRGKNEKNEKKNTRLEGVRDSMHLAGATLSSSSYMKTYFFSRNSLAADCFVDARAHQQRSRELHTHGERERERTRLIIIQQHLCQVFLFK